MVKYGERKYKCGQWGKRFSSFGRCCLLYVDPTTSSNAMNAFFGSKERVRIPLSGKHCSLQAFVKHVVEHAGLREEAQKRGLGSRIDIKLCRLEKGPDCNKLISGHPGGLTPGNPAPGICTNTFANSTYQGPIFRLPQQATTVPFPEEHKSKGLPNCNVISCIIYNKSLTITTHDEFGSADPSSM